MNRKTLAAAFLALASLTGCAHRVVYTESCAEPEPVVVHRTVVVAERRPHYYRRPYCPPTRVVVRDTRPTYRPHYDRGYSRSSREEWARREERSSDRGATVRARADVRTHRDVRIHAEASAR